MWQDAAEPRLVPLSVIRVADPHKRDMCLSLKKNDRALCMYYSTEYHTEVPPPTSLNTTFLWCLLRKCPTGPGFFIRHNYSTAYSTPHLILKHLTDQALRRSRGYTANVYTYLGIYVSV